MKTLSIILLAIFSTSIPFSSLKAEEKPDIAIIRGFTEKWAAAWSIGSGPFDAEAFRLLFAPSHAEIEVFDNVQGDVIVLTSVDEYVETWKPFMEPLTHWSLDMKDLRIRVSGDLASTTFRIDGVDTRGPNNEPISFGQYGTHVWERFPDIGWRIVHEHLTNYDRGQSRSNNAISPIQSIDHVSISTSNPELVEWYREILDFEIEDRWTAPDAVPGLELMYLLHPSGTRLELAVGKEVAIQGMVPTSIAEDFSKAGFRHLCFTVENVDEMIDIARERGANVLAEPFDFPYLKKRLAFLQDPDGNSIEFVQAID